MKLAEDSATILRYCQTRNLPRVEVTPGTYYDLPCLYPIIAVVVITFLSIMSSLSASIFWIVLGTLISWIMTVILMAWRDDWERQNREYCFQLNKENQTIDLIHVDNTGKVYQRQYSYQEIVQILPVDKDNRFRICIDMKTKNGVWSETLAEFRSETERNLCLDTLSNALGLSLEDFENTDSEGEKHRSRQ